MQHARRNGSVHLQTQGSVLRGFPRSIARPASRGALFTSGTRALEVCSKGTRGAACISAQGTHARNT
eukprot:622510-Prymnesium_polylepis.1